MINQWECRECNWKGEEFQLEYEKTEGCVGNDKMEICPKCGSQLIFPI